MVHFSREAPRLIPFRSASRAHPLAVDDAVARLLHGSPSHLDSDSQRIVCFSPRASDWLWPMQVDAPAASWIYRPSHPRAHARCYSGATSRRRPAIPHSSSHVRFELDAANSDETSVAGLDADESKRPCVDSY